VLGKCTINLLRGQVTVSLIDDKAPLFGLQVAAIVQKFEVDEPFFVHFDAPSIGNVS
jgi:hypothetical protein